MTGKDISMEMITIPFEEYNELFQLRLELHMIYSKCRKDGSYAAGMFAEELMNMMHSDVFPPDRCRTRGTGDSTEGDSPC